VTKPPHLGPSVALQLLLLLLLRGSLLLPSLGVAAYTGTSSNSMRERLLSFCGAGRGGWLD
jgi:hypothetical protein